MKSNEFIDYNLIKNLVVAIGEVAEITGIPVRKLRYWEEKGIIQSQNSKTTLRKYNYLTIKKILLIDELLTEGYTLEKAAEKVTQRIEKLNEVFSKLQEENNK
ncbi:MAG: MerR family transcriptional regulator [Negativicutes bacterium]|jgi:DNA-binding transcriptional MerR regulator|nr:MerR family transcriptional regulator [Negativicutes bacterium]